MSDRNFDGIAQRFHRNIYHSPKGELRLASCRRELQEQLPERLLAPDIRVWDAGGGIGQMSADCLERGQSVVLNDVSGDMLALAATELAAYSDSGQLSLVQSPIQALAIDAPFDLVICHAVLEWVGDMEAVLDALTDGMAPDGYMSLMFYNLNALVMGNMIKGNLYKLRDEDFAGHPGGLTPPKPRDPVEVINALQARGLEIVARRGVRLSYDMMSRSLRAERSVDDMLAIDWQYGGREPFWALGRYVHLLCRRA